MLHTKCRDIGTSSGVIIPRHILEYAHIQRNDILDIDYSETEQAIIIKKSKPKQLRVGWALASKTLHERGGDNLLIPDVFEDEIFDETI